MTSPEKKVFWILPMFLLLIYLQSCIFCFFLALSYISNKWFHFFTDLYTSSTSRKRSSTFVVSHRDWSRLEKTRLKKNRKKNSIYITGAFFWALCTIYYYLTVCPISNILLLYSNTWRINVSVWRFNEKKNVTENIFWGSALDGYQNR